MVAAPRLTIKKLKLEALEYSALLRILRIEIQFIFLPSKRQAV